MRGYPYRHGTAVALADGTLWPSCATYPAPDAESLGTPGARVGAWQVIGPHDSTARKGDALTFDGRDWIITEDPEPYRSPFTGWAPGTVLTVRPTPTSAELADHRRLAAASMLDMILVERSTPTGFDHATGRTLHEWVPIYSGPADLAAATHGAAAIEAGEVTASGSRTITAPAEVLASEGDRVTVAASPGTPSLMGAVWWVTSATYASSADATDIEVREVP